MSKERGIGLTVEEWMLVHLLRFSRYEGEFEVPWGMTQYGIAEAVGTGQDHVSRAAKKLVQKGLVTESKSRVEGVQERRKIYSLSAQGQVQASELQRRVEESPVRLREGATETVMALREALRALGHSGPLIEAARSVRPDGTLDREAVGAGRRPEGAGAAPAVPAPKYFVGRARDLQTLKGWLETHRILVILGMPGIGKTALAAQLASDVRALRPVFWYRFHEWDTLRNLLVPLGDFLAQQGRRKLKTYLSSKADTDLNDVCYTVVESSRGLRALLVLDDAHKASEEFLPCFSMLTEVLEKSEGLRVLLTARHLRQFYDRKDVLVRGVVAEMRLEGLDEESSRRLLKARHVEERHHDRAFRLTSGHPLALELFSPGGSGADERLNMMKYMEEEVASKLSSGEKRLLRLASVHRHPVPADALLCDGDLDYEVLTGLLGRSLVRESPGERYDIHDLLRDFFRSRMPPQERARLHEEASRFYSGINTPRERLEFIHHSLRAGKVGEAARALADHGEELLSAGHVGELRWDLDELTPGAAGGSEGKLTFLRARTADILGDWDGALELYRRSLEGIEEGHRAEVHYHVGWIQQKRNLWREAAESFRLCLELSKARRDHGGVARAHHGLGRVLWREGDWAAAARYLGKSIEMARRAGERELEASAGIELGRVLANSGKFEQAERCLRRSLELLEATGSGTEVARAHNCLGWEIFRPQGKLSEALEVLHRGEELALSQGSLRELGPIYHSLGEIWVRKGELGRAEEYFSRSLEIFDRQGDLHGSAFNYLGFGILNRERRNWEKARDWFEKAVDGFEKVKTPNDLAYALSEYSEMWSRQGDDGKARALRARSERISRELRGTDKAGKARPGPRKADGGPPRGNGL